MNTLFRVGSKKKFYESIAIDGWQVSFEGDPWLGLIISSVCKTQQDATQIALGIFYPNMLLSGPFLFNQSRGGEYSPCKTLGPGQ